MAAACLRGSLSHAQRPGLPKPINPCVFKLLLSGVFCQAEVDHSCEDEDLGDNKEVSPAFGGAPWPSELFSSPALLVLPGGDP